MTEIDRRIAAIQGYIELGLPQEARAEMATLPPEAADRVDVVELEVLCCIAQRNWGTGLHHAMKLCAMAQGEPGGFVHAAYCLHELARTDEALALLMAGPPSLRRKAVFYYNVGCYNASLGRMDQALLMLEQAFLMKPELRLEARRDPDLAVLRGQLR